MPRTHLNWSAGEAQTTAVELPHEAASGRRAGGDFGPALAHRGLCGALGGARIKWSAGWDLLTNLRWPNALSRYPTEIRELAYDLDYFEPDARLRAESGSYFGAQ